MPVTENTLDVQQHLTSVNIKQTGYYVDEHITALDVPWLTSYITNPQITERQRQIENSTDGFTDECNLWM